MNAKTENSLKKIAAWCGPIWVLGYIISFGFLGHNIPPPNMMALSSHDLVSQYYGKFPEIGYGMIACCAVGLLYLPWTCLLASLLRDSKGQMGLLSLFELTGGLLTAWVLAWAPAMWATCSILAGQVDPDIIKFVHTATWIVYDCTFMITTTQYVGLGLYTVLNKEQKMFPAWAGWLAIATGASFVTEVFIPFTTDGPFTVSGAWNYYIVFGTWIFAVFAVYSYFIIKAVNKEGAAL